MLKVAALSFLLLLFQSFEGEAQIKVVKGLNYANSTNKSNSLNVYYKTGDSKSKPVLVFIHGGSWYKGNKDLYWWLGRNLAKKGVVAVIINYPLAPKAKYEQIASACALSLKWVKENIQKYCGNADKIFVMGHSVGGHLAELINADTTYFAQIKIANPIKGIILNDAFGLDMYEYMTKAKKDQSYYIFQNAITANQAEWKKSSPLTYIKQVKTPHLLFYGSKTYDIIQMQTKRIDEELKEQNIAVNMHVVEGRTHIPMIGYMFFSDNRLYNYILDFIYKPDQFSEIVNGN